MLATRIFSGAWDQPLCVPCGTRHHLSVFGMTCRIYLAGPPTGLNRDIQHPDDLPFSVPPSLITHHRWCRNINLLSITYAFRPRLRDRLTLGGLPFPRKPWVFGERVFHPFYRYLCRHSHFPALQRSLRSAFNAARNAPLPHTLTDIAAASVPGLSPVGFSAPSHLTSELLRFL